MKKHTYTAPWIEVEKIELSNVIMSSVNETPGYEGGNEYGEDTGGEKIF